MANPISNDIFPASPVLEQQKSDAEAGRSPDSAFDKNTSPPGDNPDLDRAHQRLAQESGDVRQPVIVSASEAKQKATLLKDLMSGSPVAAVKAHGNMEINAFEAAMARPAA